MYSLLSFSSLWSWIPFLCLLGESPEFVLHIVLPIFCYSSSALHCLQRGFSFAIVFSVFLTILLYLPDILWGQTPESRLKPCCPLRLPPIHQHLQLFPPPKYFFKLSFCLHLYCRHFSSSHHHLIPELRSIFLLPLLFLLVHSLYSSNWYMCIYLNICVYVYYIYT